MKQNELKDNSIPVLGSYNYENLFNVYRDEDGYYFYTLLKNVYFPSDMAPSLYAEVTPFPNELLPQLSYRLYNVTNLWWLIASMNRIDNPLEPLNPEVPLKVVGNDIIRSILTTIRQN